VVSIISAEFTRCEFPVGRSVGRDVISTAHAHKSVDAMHQMDWTAHQSLAMHRSSELEHHWQRQLTTFGRRLANYTQNVFDVDRNCGHYRPHPTVVSPVSTTSYVMPEQLRRESVVANYVLYHRRLKQLEYQRPDADHQTTVSQTDVMPTSCRPHAEASSQPIYTAELNHQLSTGSRNVSFYR